MHFSHYKTYNFLKIEHSKRLVSLYQMKWYSLILWMLWKLTSTSQVPKLLLNHHLFTNSKSNLEVNWQVTTESMGIKIVIIATRIQNGRPSKTFKEINVAKWQLNIHGHVSSDFIKESELVWFRMGRTAAKTDIFTDKFFDWWRDGLDIQNSLII